MAILNYQKARKILDKITDRAVLLATDIYADQVIKWITDLNKLKSFQTLSIQPPDSASRELTFNILMTSALLGKLVAKEIINQDTKQFSEYSLFDIDFEDIGFLDAMNLLKKKSVLTSAEFKAAEGYIKNITFSIQRIERIEIINTLHESLIATIKSAESFEDWQEKLPKIFDSYGITPLKNHHLETVYRTNIASTYNDASWDQYLDDDNTEAIQFVAIPDARVRPEHLAYDGYIAAKTDPIWNTISPPLDYNCRCGTIPISRQRIAREKITFDKITPAQNKAKDLLSPDFKKRDKGLKSLSAKIDDYEKEKNKERAVIENELKQTIRKNKS